MSEVIDSKPRALEVGRMERTNWGEWMKNEIGMSEAVDWEYTKRDRTNNVINSNNNGIQIIIGFKYSTVVVRVCSDYQVLRKQC